MTQPMTAVARSGVNFALVKYWGKRDTGENLPAVGSLSLTLDAPGTQTRVTFDPMLVEDVGTLDGAPLAASRLRPVLDAVRQAAGIVLRARVVSHNTVATAAGLASSASGFAALATAAWAAAGLPRGEVPAAALVRAARLGSGSAARSLLGGFVELDCDTGEVRPLMVAGAWPLALCIALTDRGPKDTSSRDGMAASARTSPYYRAWIASHPADLDVARAAVRAGDLAALGEVMEHSTLKMHACMLATRPPLWYWRPATLAAIEAVRDLRAGGVGAWFTVDAGPHVKVLCEVDDAPGVAARLADAPGVDDVRIARPGVGAEVVEVGGQTP